MVGLKLDLKNAGITEKSILKYSKEVEKIHTELHEKKDDENEFLGWCKSTFLNMTPEEKEAAKSYANICNLRKKFYLWKAEQEEANV